MMKFKLLTSLLLIAIGLPLKAAEPASRPTRPKGPSRDEFKDVVVYNIFDPERGPKPPPPPRKSEERKPPPPRTDRLTLTGIIMGKEGNYGFFDGSARDFQSVVKQGDKLAEFNVDKVTTEYVDLKLGTNTFQLQIRGELSKKGDEAWQLSSTSAGGFSRTSSYSGSRSSAGDSSSATTSSTSSSSSSSGDDSDDDRRKRLLELLKKRREAGK